MPRVILRTNGISDPLLPRPRPCRSRDSVPPSQRRYPRRVLFGRRHGYTRALMQTIPNGLPKRDKHDRGSFLARRWSPGQQFYDHDRRKRESLDRRKQISAKSIANRRVTFYQRSFALILIPNGAARLFLLLFPSTYASEKSRALESRFEHRWIYADENVPLTTRNYIAPLRRLRNAYTHTCVHAFCRTATSHPVEPGTEHTALTLSVMRIKVVADLSRQLHRATKCEWKCKGRKTAPSWIDDRH